MTAAGQTPQSFRHWQGMLLSPTDTSILLVHQSNKKRSRSWTAGNNENMDIREVVTWKIKEKLQQLGLEDKVIVVD